MHVPKYSHCLYIRLILMRSNPKEYQSNMLRPWGGGGVLPLCMHIGYVPQERTPIFSPDFPFRSISFSQITKKICSGASSILHFLADFAVPETIIFKISLISNPFIASHGRLSPAPRVSGRSRDSHFHAQTAQARSGLRSPAFSTLKTAQARSGAPHFHARPARELVPEPLPIFHFAAAHTYPKFGVNTPPPPGLRHLIIIQFVRSDVHVPL